MPRLFLLCLFLSVNSLFAQSKYTLKGTVRDERNEPLSNVNVKVQPTERATTTNSEGFYFLALPSATSYKVSFSRTGYISKTIEIKGQNSLLLDVVLNVDVNELESVSVNVLKNGNNNFQKLDAGLIQNIPTASGNFESLLKTLPGVSTNNELSSQYSVRGGNFDENLTYINDIEIFRPLLIRNGQQEGLSFINPELVTNASFSAGGFDARYGDKMSSVLDVKYGRPDSSQLNLSAGLLALSATAKLKYKSAYLLVSARNKANQSILRTQQVKGSYSPRFYDFQLLYNLDLSKKLTLSTFGNYNLSRFYLIPESRETVFGTLNKQYRLDITFAGQEKDSYESFAGGLTLSYRPNHNLWFKWLNSAFSNKEEEAFDIEGGYIFDEVASVGGFDNVRVNRGIGVNYNYGRNNLEAKVYSSELRAYYQTSGSFWEAGFRYQHDQIIDDLNEYELVDSAGYSLPYGGSGFPVIESVFANNQVRNTRLTAYIQNTFNVNSRLNISAGLRNSYNTYTSENLVSPRVSAVLNPLEKSSWRLAAGMYYQPPYYREMRRFDGSLTDAPKAQRSIHFLAAHDRIFNTPSTTLKFSSEIFYKRLDNLIPYKVDNLRIRYFADQKANGYATGADFALNGEFVNGLESSFRLSVMKSAEDIIGDKYEVRNESGKTTIIEPGYLKRPTDQRLNVSLFFQDKLFRDPSYKVHLTLLYGSALPVGPPQTERYQDRFKIPAYKRADIGFSKDFLVQQNKKKSPAKSKYFDSLIAYAEVFNLLNINNTVSYLWIKDVTNNQFAIPNYLTSRQLNIKIIAKFKN